MGQPLYRSIWSLCLLILLFQAMPVRAAKDQSGREIGVGMCEMLAVWDAKFDISAWPEPMPGFKYCKHGDREIWTINLYPSVNPFTRILFIYEEKIDTGYSKESVSLSSKVDYRPLETSIGGFFITKPYQNGHCVRYFALYDELLGDGWRKLYRGGIQGTFCSPEKLQSIGLR